MKSSKQKLDKGEIERRKLRELEEERKLKKIEDTSKFNFNFNFFFYILKIFYNKKY